jgi:phage N-6-adenine-methyltransferase
MQTSGIGHRDEPGSALITCAEAAAMMDVPVHYVEAAGIVQEHGDLELIKKVERGEVDVLDAVAICLNFTEISQDTIKAMVEAHKWLDKKVTAGSLVQMVEMFGREDPEEPISEARDLKIVEAARRILVEKAKDQTQFGNEVADDADVTVHNHRAQGTHDNEWYTPGDYVEAAREVMGSIDLDPASSGIANQTVQAAQFFTIEDDGLQQTWTGNVWMNPPYAQPGIAQFMSKLTAEIAKGTATQAIALTHSYTDTAWFQSAAAVSDAVCFTRGRIAFLDPNGKKAAPTQGQAFFYFGPNAAKFAEVFGPIGWVVMGNAPAMVEVEAAG